MEEGAVATDIASKDVTEWTGNKSSKCKMPLSNSARSRDWRKRKKEETKQMMCELAQSKDEIKKLKGDFELFYQRFNSLRQENDELKKSHKEREKHVENLQQLLINSNNSQAENEHLTIRIADPENAMKDRNEKLLKENARLKQENGMLINYVLFLKNNDR
ncbi:uncharacterized protein LOC111297909 [Durio zibethinus]|uniref:Uncharacterized protein LOC111297909 n=1 Tax=Durio zibethinus TaxID=66656 RepID=A0A6P5Z650_DURZI|nr:uncharacterized protein LOC111297909 [Durio zibethinus]